MFFTFVFSTLIAASVTFRLEMRWLYAPFVGLLFLISYMIKVILTDNILGKISLIFIMIWLCLVAPVGIFYRSYYKNLYYWGSQTFGNSLYENTLEKYGENFWKLKTYIYCSEKSSYYMLGCSDYINVNYFFKQYKKKEEKSFIYLINKISEIPKEINSQKILLLTYDQSEGKFINLKIGTELRKTILKNGWYGWSDDKTSIWTGNDVEALFKTGDKGEMTLEGFIPEYNLPNTVTFFIDDKLISKFYIENPNIKINIETPENKIINLRFTVDHFKSPAELKVGADVRELEILVTDIKFK